MDSLYNLHQLSFKMIKKLSQKPSKTIEAQYNLHLIHFNIYLKKYLGVKNFTIQKKRNVHSKIKLKRLESNNFSINDGMISKLL